MALAGTLGRRMAPRVASIGPVAASPREDEIATSSRAPLRLSLRAAPTADRVVLTVRLERSALFSPLPSRLSWRLPAGTRLVRGEIESDLLLGASVEATIEIAIDGADAPPDDVVATVDVAGEGRSARGEIRHRFGRPVPPLVSPPRRAREKTRDGGTLGTGIRVIAKPR